MIPFTEDQSIAASLITLGVPFLLDYSQHEQHKKHSCEASRVDHRSELALNLATILTSITNLSGSYSHPVSISALSSNTCPIPQCYHLLSQQSETHKTTFRETVPQFSPLILSFRFSSFQCHLLDKPHLPLVSRMPSDLGESASKKAFRSLIQIAV